MPIEELIKDQEDRELTTGPGNWTGDCIWDPGPYYDKLGFLAMPFDGEYQEKQTQLQYPALKATAGDTINLWVTWIHRTPDKAIDYKYYYLSDGNYMLLGTYVGWEMVGSWNRVQYRFTTPADWNPNNSTLILKAINGTDYPVDWCLDDFSLIGWEEELPPPPPVIPKVQYLPLVGIG